MSEQANELDDAERASIEAEARQAGWTGRDSFRGDPERFVDAPEYVRRAREHLPLVNTLLQKERARVAELEAFKRQATESFKDFEKRLKAQDATHAQMLKFQQDTLLERFETEKRSALTIADPTQRQNAYDAAQRREMDAIRGLTSVPHAAVEPQISQINPQQISQPYKIDPSADALAKDWVAKEPWLQNPVTLAAASSFPVAVDFNTDPIGHLEAVKAEMERRFPGSTTKRVENNSETSSTARSNGAQHARVEGSGSRSAGRSSKVKSFDQLPSEAKTACMRMIETKLVKGDAKAFQARYAAEWFKNYDGN